MAQYLGMVTGRVDLDMEDAFLVEAVWIEILLKILRTKKLCNVLENVEDINLFAINFV